MNRAGFSLEFTEKIYEIKNNLSYGWIAYHAIVDDVIALSFADKGIIIDGSYAAPTGDFVLHARSLDGSPDRFMWFLVRGAIILLYEAFKEDFVRYKIVRDEAWFRLLASLRHSLAHGTSGEWRKVYAYANNPIVFKRLFDNQEFVINESLKDKPINTDIFGGMISIIDLFTHAIRVSDGNTFNG